jgi:CHAD domain-containing protein
VRGLKKRTMPIDRKRIQKPARKLRKLLKKLSSAPGPEQVHSFRTNARRLETVLETTGLDKTNKGRQLRKQIAKLRRHAGKVRDFDVLTEYVSGIPHDPSESECSVTLLEYLGSQRVRHARKFHKLQKRHSSRLNRLLQRATKTIEKTFPSKGGGRLNGKPIAATVSASALTILSELLEPPKLRRSNLHEYRLRVKDLRNLLQMAKNSGRQPFVDHLGDVKDAIGEWHDWEVLMATATEILDHGRNCRLQENLRKTVLIKYQRALRLSEAMRRDDLRVTKSRRNNSSQTRRLQPAEQVWSATASLAA